MDKSCRDIAFSCDDNGAKFLRVTVWSLLKHYRGREPLRINVFEGFGGHSAESKAKLKSIVEEFNQSKPKVEVEQRNLPSCASGLEKEANHRCSTSTSDFDFFSVRYINIEKAVEPYADLIMNREKSRWNVFTWTPIFTPLLLADATGNVAHFDIDMLFNDDVSKILDLDLGDNLIAAVAEYGKGDPVITEAVWGKGILPPEAERYFNTGTIVFNTAKCRKERTWEKILAWYREHYDIADRIEQDAWNALYWKRTKLLPLRWNFHDRLIRRFAGTDVFQRFWQGNPPRECLDAALNPAILHFWGPKKPWKTCHRPYRKLYHAAMRAVGQVPPREPLSARWHDFRTRRVLSELSLLVASIDKGYVRAVGSMDGYRKLVRSWRRKALARDVKHVLLFPFEWGGILLGCATLPFLPHRAMLACCDVVSAFVYWLDRRGRRLAEENVRLIPTVARASQKTVRKIVRRSYRNMVRTVGHAFWTCFRGRVRVAAVGEMSGAARDFLATHKPAVTVSGHVGCWEILSQLALLEGHAMLSVAKDIGTPAMTRLLMRARRSVGQEIVHAKGAFKPLLRGIRAGKSLGLLVDQRVDPNEGGIWVRFLGRPMTVSAAPAFFASKGNAPIITAWSRPLKDGRYRCEAIGCYSDEDARDVWRMTQRCAADLERVIRRHPSCWVSNYNFFSNVPTDEDLKTLEKRERTMRGKAGGG